VILQLLQHVEAGVDVRVIRRSEKLSGANVPDGVGRKHDADATTRSGPAELVNGTSRVEKGDVSHRLETLCIGAAEIDYPARHTRHRAPGARAEARCPFEIGRLPEDSDPAGVGWSYHRDQLGLRFELVAETMRPMLEEFAFKPAP
jgi:hypothetical protein